MLYLKVTGKIFLLIIMIFALSLIPLVIIIPEEMTAKQIMADVDLMKKILIISNLIYIASVGIMYWLFEKNNGLKLGLKTKEKKLNFIKGTFWGSAIIIDSFIILWILRAIEVITFTIDSSTIISLGYGIVLFLFVAVGEEIMFRGYIQGLLKKHFGVKAAVIVSSILFMIMHLYNEHVLQSIVPIITLFLAGILLAITKDISGGLWVPIGIHFGWNYFQGYIFGFPVSGFSFENTLFTVKEHGHHLISGGDFGLEGSLIIVLMISLVIWIWANFKAKKEDSILL